MWMRASDAVQEGPATLAGRHRTRSTGVATSTASAFAGAGVDRSPQSIVIGHEQSAVFDIAHHGGQLERGRGLRALAIRRAARTWSCAFSVTKSLKSGSCKPPVGCLPQEGRASPQGRSRPFDGCCAPSPARSSDRAPARCRRTCASVTTVRPRGSVTPDGRLPERRDPVSFAWARVVQPSSSIDHPRFGAGLSGCADNVRMTSSDLNIWTAPPRLALSCGTARD